MQHADDLDVGADAVDHHEGRAGNHQLAREWHSPRPSHGWVLRQGLDGQADAVQGATRGGRVVARDVIGLVVKGAEGCPEPSNAHDAGTVAW